MRSGTAAGLVTAAAITFAACGENSSEQAAQGPAPTVIAKAVPPAAVTPDASADLPEAGSEPDGTALPSDELPSANPEEQERAPARRPRSTKILSAGDKASFARLVSEFGGAGGLAVSGVGRGQNVERVGSMPSAIAWSTAKVPVAMAVVDAGGQSAQAQNLSAAITASDNGAALKLWSSLGSADQAADATTAELRNGGDGDTRIESQTLRSGLTPFGQTAWPLADQARFTAAMPCSASGQVVLGLMGQVIPGQRWGLGAVDQAAQFKGGWGPGSEPGVAGGYLNRQMGIITVAGKPLAVSIASAPADGSHETGQRALTAIAKWLTSHANTRNVPQAPAC